MSVRLAFGGLIVSAMLAPACATASGARPEPFPNLPAPAPAVTAVPATPPVPESVVTSAPLVTSSATATTVSGSDNRVPLVPLSAPATPPPPDVPKLNPSRSSASDRVLATKRLDAATKAALSLRGTRYRLGGESLEDGFDCSGLVHYVFEQQQIDVPRIVADQFQVGDKIALADVQRGDLLFFSTTGPGATHVGIALGTVSQGEFVHAPGAGGSVRVERFDAPYWRGKLVGVRRVY